MCMHVSVCVCVHMHTLFCQPLSTYVISDMLSAMFLITDEIYLEHFVAVADSMAT